MADDTDEDDGFGGRPVEFPDEAFLDALRTADGGATTDEVADEVGCADRTAHARLTDLKDRGVVTSRRIGQQHLWRLADD